MDAAKPTNAKARRSRAWFVPPQERLAGSQGETSCRRGCGPGDGAKTGGLHGVHAPIVQRIAILVKLAETALLNRNTVWLMRAI
jgi:hypothetical protein